MLPNTRERVLPGNFESREEYLIYLCHLFAYEFVEKRIPQGCRVLEVGSGEGYGTYKLSKSGKFKEIIGIDVDPESVKHASRKYKSSRLHFKHYKGGRIPFRDNSFDAVVSLQVIEHIQDDEKYISEIYRLLKKQGIYILTTPNRVYRLNPGQKPWNRFHVREYSSKTLENVLRHYFKDVRIFGIRGNDEIQKIELERVRKNLRLNTFDPLRLRTLIPKSLKPLVIKIIRRVIFKELKGGSGFISKYSIKDYYVVKEGINDSIDLLAVCKKVH